MLYGKKKYEEDFNYIMKRYEDNLNDKSWIEHLLNAVKNNNIKNKSYSTLGVISWDANVFFVNATKSYLIDKDIESYKRNMYVGSKLSIMGEDSRNFLVYDRRTMFRILASNNQDLIHFIKKYPELLTYRIKNKFLKQDIQSYLTKTVLLAFLGKWEEVLDRCNTYFQNKPASGYYNLASVEFDFLNALAEKNVEQMKKNIDKMLDKKIARKLVYNMDRKFEFWLQMYAVMYLKIALYHGYDFEIDCDICPKDLIDNTPAKEYPEPFEFMNKFDLKTITPEKWKEWIYEYCKNKEELLEDEKAGYFIQTITVEENSNLSIDKAENIAAIIGTTDNGKISPKAPNTSAIYDKVDKEQITRATAINTEISLKGKEISAEELGFKAGFEYKISAFWIGVGGGIDIDKNQGEFYHDEGIEDSGVKFMINAGYDYVYKIENPNKTVKQAIRDFVSDPEKTSENLKTMKIIYDLIKKYEGVKSGKNNKQQSTTKKIYIWCNYSHYTRIYYFIHNLKFENYFRYFYRIYIILFSNVYHYIF